MVHFGSVKHLYIGCRVRVNRNGETRILTGTLKHQLYCKRDNARFIDKFDIDQVTPLLRPLSDITLHEVEQYRTLQNMPEIPTEIRTQGLTPSAFHYLLSRGFDLFELVDNGQAMDATKLDRDPYFVHKLAGTGHMFNL
jgi:hypothetical protein